MTFSVFTKSQIEEKVCLLRQESKWNHQFHLPGDITTIAPSDVPNSAGSNIVKWERLTKILGPKFFKDKTVLDVGCSDGFFAIKAAEFASFSLGLDLDNSRIKKALFIKEVLQRGNCSFECAGVDDVENKFDVALVLGLIHRVENPIGLLRSICSRAETIIIEYKRLKTKGPFSKFHGGASKSNQFNGLYFTPSFDCLTEILKSFGFYVTEFEKMRWLSNQKYPRHIIVAKKEPF